MADFAARFSAARCGWQGLVLLSSTQTAQWVVPPLVLFLLGSQHRRRTDLDFLHLTAPRFRPWVATEYALWGLPAALVLVGFGRVGAGLLTVTLAPLAAWLSAARARTTQHQKRSAFRSEAFEWVSGFRQAGTWLGWLALVAAAGWWRQYGLAPALTLGVWVLYISSFYATPSRGPCCCLRCASRGRGCGVASRWGCCIM
ncbi:hypothetical protein [Hymenobacter volaticus]|uniref:MFS transporter n=1 Tax=Hymenobacter volaticus TaxID=2932254 RepID=A0ABY4GBI1_9BACT|nr:hypothetical protein [Hymenobacter volaticus]UOQ68141.1 hypothetical protein MUN86_09980 [Hymenobacter volaticus]